MFKSNYLSSNDMSWGTWENEELFMNTYCHYSDLVMETLLEKLLPKVIKNTELNLAPTYSYLRMYKNNDVLTRHRDRPACEISVTACIKKYDKWPLLIEKDLFELNEGDALLYAGCDHKHGRPGIYKGEGMAQVFLHYVNKNGPYKDHAYDNKEKSK